MINIIQDISDRYKNNTSRETTIDVSTKLIDYISQIMRNTSRMNNVDELDSYYLLQVTDRLLDLPRPILMQAQNKYNSSRRLNIYFIL